MNYYDSNDNSGKRFGMIGVAIYVIVMIVLLLCVKYRMDYEPPLEGLVVDFGNSETGIGEEDLALADAGSRPQSFEAVDDDQIMAAEQSDVEIALSDPKPKPKKQVVVDQPTEAKPKDEPKPQTVDKRALFPGNAAKPNAAQGQIDGSGNQGTMEGEKSDSYAQGGNTAGGSVSFSLAGRRPRGEFPRPAYKVAEQGKVVVEITVNGKGDVIGAKYRSLGSTTQSQQLVDEALKAARGAKFSEDPDNELQTGTIVYLFKLK